MADYAFHQRDLEGEYEADYLSRRQSRRPKSPLTLANPPLTNGTTTAVKSVPAESDEKRVDEDQPQPAIPSQARGGAAVADLHEHDRDRGDEHSQSRSESTAVAGSDAGRSRSAATSRSRSRGRSRPRLMDRLDERLGEGEGLEMRDVNRLRKDS